VHIANVSSIDFSTIKSYADPLILDANVLGATSTIKAPAANYQEGHFSSWIKQTFAEEVPVWMINKNAGPQTLKDSYKRIVHHLAIDAIIVLDSGLNSIVTGLEIDCPKAMIDSSINLFAIRDLEVPNKMLFTIGMSPEVEEQGCYFDVMKNITRMSQQGGAFGCCSLMSYMQSYNQFKNLVSFVGMQSDGNIHKLNSNLIASVEGIDLDNPYGQELYVSPLLSQYWMFDANAAIYNNKMIEFVEGTESFYDVVQQIVPRLKKSV
jgi:hypothetical protein